ncbi:MAG: DUF885 domain-containing protein [Shewanella psychromarinicola]|jgi:hypothetical protein|uniref:DUF885 domain-containing protein n=1 Tax=Shewanella TaxID=22 RepID=UPI000C342B87|nr:DUF885 domain-containing protein [Shewanella sp. Actino-trap-3]PKG77504.1 DUF885 domain-containing protein [Shewanella sp. Actino-trap-3]|tara:strand:+ start:62418 stop:64154 length:1737 start_codon:yes stop_codon:yes gene_type:complete
MPGKIFTSVIPLLVLLPFTSSASSWVDISNQYTNKQIKIVSQFQPELASSIGITAVDSQCSNITKAQNDKFIRTLESSKKSLQQALETEKLLPVRQDLNIIIGNIDQTIATGKLDDKYMLPWVDVPLIIFRGVSALLDEQMPDIRKQAAMSRLACYVGKSGQPALTEQAKTLFETALTNKSLMGPTKVEVNQALARFDTLITGLQQLFDKNNFTTANDNMVLLTQQIEDYRQWAEQTVIPHSRADFRLPAEIYALKLKTVGIDIEPQLLIEQAKTSYMITKANMQALAPLVAKKFDLPSDDYRDVIKALKNQSLANDKIEDYYRDINQKLEQMITEHHVVDLPKRDMLMRLATEAEAAGSPAPHMVPPPFIGNTGEQGQFILTTGNPALSGDAAYDDFNFNAVAYTLSAHEGRPGHELQFSVMLEQGVSLARVYYAFNSVNVEGWALYAEAEMLPYLPIEAQLIALQHRLLRNARAMLDPMLNLGLTTKEHAYTLLRNDVVFSEAAVKQEVDRYTMRMPGQAGSYFYGLSRLLEIRAGVEIALGDKFDRLAFNNFVLKQGLIPPQLMAEAVNKHFLAQ